MRKMMSIAAVLLLILSACKNPEKSEAREEGFVIQGQLRDLPDSSIAVLSYLQEETRVIDSAAIVNGAFRFQGTLIHPAEASIRLRHGASFPEEQWRSDSYSFYIENTNMQLSSVVDSIKNARIAGSVLTDQSVELASQMNPLTDEIQALFKRMDTRGQEDKLITYDTIQTYVDSIRSVASRFIAAHPDSYVALQKFLRHAMPKNFDAEVAQASFKKFPESLRSTTTGKLIAEKIAIAKRTMLGVKAMDFTQHTPEGEAFTLSSLEGNYVLIDFWAAWCKPCRVENPFLVIAYNQYSNENFEIVGVSLDAGQEQWESAIEKDGLPWIHVSDLKYWKNEVAVQYGINSVPANILIDPDGIIIAKNLRGEALAERLSEIFL